MPATRPAGFLREFPRTFWTANVMELFERGAYYGMNSVLAVYLSNKVADGGLGFAEQAVGFLQSIVYALTYIVPILGGALADRYGYRRMLLFAFGFLSAGYFAAGQVSAYGVVFASLMLMAVGSGLFKPIISGTIARTTTEKNSGFGFGIYYWMINLGAFLAPLVVSWLKGFDWKYVFIASSLYCALMFVPTLFFYRDPPRPQSTKSLREVLAGAAMVLGDARFMLMIVVYSCFWILYFQNFGSVLWYLRDFIDGAPVDRFFAGLGIPFKFDAEHVTVINAGTIILLQVLVSRIVRDFRPLPTMVAGIFLGSCGFLCLSLSTSVWVFIAGIAVFSLGEMTTHPKYYSYIGIVAPADRKAVYMGYAFLYGVIGSLVGSSVGGAMYESMLKPLVGQAGVEAKLRGFWLIFAALGALASLGMIAYNRIFGDDTPRTRALARGAMTVVYLLIVAIGAWFLISQFQGGGAVSPKVVVQAVIMLALGGGGLAINLRRSEGPAAGA